MSKYTEVSGSGANTNIVATGGINALGLVGAYERVMFAESAHKFESIAASKIQDNYDADAISGMLTFLGKCKFEDNSEEAQFFTDPALTINIETTAATKVIRSILQVNACVHAELKKMNGKTGRVFFQTTNGFVVGRYEDDGDVVGRECTVAVSQRSVPTTDTPVEYTIIDITLTDNDGDELNPFEAKIDWLFSEVEQVYPITGTVDNVTSDGSTVDFDLALTKAGSNAALPGATLADFSATDEDGNPLSIASAVEGGSTGVYAVSVTTTGAVAYIKFNGRRTIGGSTYYFDTVLAQA
jgi:hypothetical protein